MFHGIRSLFNKGYETMTRLVTSGDLIGTSEVQGMQALNFYDKSLYVNAALRKRAEKVGEIEFIIRNAKTGDIDESAEAAKWLNLINRPNKYQTKTEFWELAQKHYDISGTVFIRKVSAGAFGTVTELELLRPDQMQIVLNRTKTEIVRFEYAVEGEKEIIDDLDSIIYINRARPLDPLLGESLLSAASSAIETEIDITRYNAKVIRRGGQLDTIFKLKSIATKTQLDEVEESYDEKVQKRIGKPMFMGGDLEKVVTGLSPKELSYLETKVQTLEDICIATGVPKEVLGVTSGATYANADASIRVFLRETIKPLHQKFADILDWRLIPDNLWLDTVDPTPEDREELRKDVETAHAVEALTTNEKREMLNQEPRLEPEADQILVPFTKRPLDAQEEPEQEPETEPEQEEKALSKKGKHHPLKQKDFRILWAKFVNARRAVYDRQFLGAVRTFFGEQEARVLKDLKRTKRKIAVDEVFNSGIEINLAKSALTPIIRELFIEQGQAVAETFGLPTFTVSNHVERVLQARADLFTNSIIHTTGEQLSHIFKESFEAGENRSALVERIQELYQDISAGRAEVIARTEVHAAQQEANLEAYRQGGLETKVWVWSGNTDNLREIHFDIDGEERGLNEPFSTGEMVPSLPNCACTI
jgi:HK97 family phage portal protein